VIALSAATPLLGAVGVKGRGAGLTEAMSRISAFIADRERVGDAATLEQVAAGGVVVSPPYGAVNYSDGKPERVQQRAEAAAAAARVRARQSPIGTVATAVGTAARGPTGKWVGMALAALTVLALVVGWLSRKTS